MRLLYLIPTVPTLSLRRPYCITTASLRRPYGVPMVSLLCPYSIPTPTPHCPHSVPTPSLHRPYTVPTPSLHCPYTIPTPSLQSLQSPYTTYTIPTALGKIPLQNPCLESPNLSPFGEIHRFNRIHAVLRGLTVLGHLHPRPPTLLYFLILTTF